MGRIHTKIEILQLQIVNFNFNLPWFHVFIDCSRDSPVMWGNDLGTIAEIDLKPIVTLGIMTSSDHDTSYKMHMS